MCARGTEKTQTSNAHAELCEQMRLLVAALHRVTEARVRALAQETRVDREAGHIQWKGPLALPGRVPADHLRPQRGEDWSIGLVWVQKQQPKKNPCKWGFETKERSQLRSTYPVAFTYGTLPSQSATQTNWPYRDAFRGSNLQYSEIFKS